MEENIYELILKEIISYGISVAEKDLEKQNSLFKRIKILLKQLEQQTKIECYKDAIKIVSGG